MSEQINIDIKIQSADAAESIGQMNKALKDLKSAQESVDRSSPDFKKLADAINKTEGRIGDLNDSFKTLTGSGVERFRASLGLAGEGLRNLDWDKFKIGIKGATQAFGGLKAALSALGIGLIVSAVTYLIENFEELKNSSGLLGTAIRAIGDIITSLIDGFYKLTDAIGLTNHAIEKQSELAIEKAKETEVVVNERYDKEIKLAEAAGKSTLDIEKEKSRAVLATLKTQVDAIIAVAKANGSYSDDQLKQLKDLTKQANDIRTNLLVSEIKDNKKKNADL